MPSLTESSALAAAVAKCGDAFDIVEVFNDYKTQIGCVAAIVHNFRLNSEDFDWKPLFCDFPPEIDAEYRRSQTILTDPLVRESLRTGRPAHAKSVYRHTAKSGEFLRFCEVSRAAGVIDGLGMIAVARPGSISYVGLAFGQSLAGRQESALIKIQRDIEMLARRCASVAPLPDDLKLSKLEFEALSRLASGGSNKSIARDLGLAPCTVDTLVNRAFRKLGVRSRAEAIRRAVKSGFLVAA